MLAPAHTLVLNLLAERLGSPLVIVDVGAQTLASEAHVYQPLLDAGVPVEVIGFEPQADRAAARRAERECGVTVIEAFVGDGGEHLFHQNSSDGASSLLPLNSELCAGFASLAGLRTVGTELVATQPLDQLLPDMPVDFLKLDIQGFELAALQGAKQLLARTAVLQAEVEFAPIYAGQPLFSEVASFVRAHGMDFLDFPVLARRAPVVPSGRLRNEQLLWADALFAASSEDASDRALLAQAIVLLGVYARPSLAERALAAYDQRRGTRLAGCLAAL